MWCDTVSHRHLMDMKFDYVTFWIVVNRIKCETVNTRSVLVKRNCSKYSIASLYLYTVWLWHFQASLHSKPHVDSVQFSIFIEIDSIITSFILRRYAIDLWKCVFLWKTHIQNQSIIVNFSLQWSLWTDANGIKVFFLLMCTVIFVFFFNSQFQICKD